MNFRHRSSTSVLFRAPLCVALTFAVAASAHAGNRAVLNKLVKKGLLTQQEADEIAAEEAAEKARKDAPVVITAREKETTKLVIAGKVQTQYKFIQTMDRTGANADAQSQGFELRRMDITLDGRVGDSFRGVVDYRAETNPPNFGGVVQPDAGFQVDKAFIEYDTRGYGLLLFGMRKANFGFEEYQSSSYLLSVERGIVNNYFSGNAASAYNLGLGERRMGLYYDSVETKKIETGGGTKFGFAVTNDIRRRFDKDSNRYAYYGDVLHVEKLGETTFFDTGLNATYTDTSANRKVVAPSAPHNRSVGIETFARLRHGDLTILADFYGAWLNNGRSGAGTAYEQAMPTGVMLMGSYLIDGVFEPVVSLNWLDTDGRGVASGDVIRNAKTYAPADRAMQIYTGFNWYLTRSKSVKLSLGLELANFRGGAQNAAAPVDTDVIGGRCQVQALF